MKKTKIQMKKKGISPLIATVLILAFAIVLAILILSWSQNLVGNMKENTENTVNAQMACVRINLNIENACISKSVIDGVDTETLNVMLSNNGQEKIEKAKLRFFKSTIDFAMDEISTGINPYETEKYSSTKPGGKEYLSTETKMIEAIPIIEKEGRETPCPGMTQKYGSLEGDYIKTPC